MKKYDTKTISSMLAKEKYVFPATLLLALGAAAGTGYSVYKHPHGVHNSEPAKEKVGGGHHSAQSTEMPSTTNLKEFTKEHGIVLNRE